MLFATSNVNDNSAEKNQVTQTHPPMSREEVESLLDSIPVYAVTEPNKEGLVLLKEKDNANEIAYFFFSPDTANALYAQFRGKNLDASWDVTQYPLGLVWFELLASSSGNEGIDYRLVPEASDLTGARTVLEEQAKQMKSEASNMFQVGYNEIPVYMNQVLRIQAADGEEKFPMYLSYQDMLMALQQIEGATPKEYEAAINVVDLRALLDQMMGSKTPTDFRKTVLVPPSLSQQPSFMRTKTESALEDDKPISTPTMTESWED